MNAGLLWKPTAAVNVGSFFRQGADVGTTRGVPGAAKVGMPLAVPEVYGLGLAVRSSGGAFVLLTEWDHVSYSGLDGVALGATVVRLDDADELHMGAEYAFLWIRPVIALRLGAWYDPSHRSLAEAGSASRLGGGELHRSGGVGISWKRFQLDFALDVSEPVITASVSGIVNF